MSGCPVGKKCGGCIYTGMPYEEQLKLKHKKLVGLLGKYGEVKPVIGMQDPLFYRNKVHHVFSWEKGKVKNGIYAEGSHRVIPVKECLIEDRKSQEIIKTIEKLVVSFKIKVFDEDTGYGLLRHVLIRRGFKSGEIMVVLVVADRMFPGKNNFIKVLRKEHPEITTVVMNINREKTSMVLGEREDVAYGPGFIKDELCGYHFRISSKSFYQVNPVQTEVLYGKAIELAGLKGDETVVDAYCGTGTIGLIASKYAGKVIGIELNPDAVRDARKNAKENKVDNAEFIKGDAGDCMERMAAEGLKTDVLFMDPPRSGSTEKFLKSVLKIAPERIVYISCGPESLARDLKLLTAGKKYTVKAIQPVDMFPQTEHVETVVQLSKGDINRDSSERKSTVKAGDMGMISGYSKGKKMPETTNVKIDFSLENLDLSELKGKATYEQIKDYVREQTGFRVSSLYISQVKRKCGLEVGESYNKPKSDDARQPQCTPEKEEAIMQALSHFGVI
ncbi:MAG: 23S rRNA (uracil(1939)-C(5))-methyltransferase RlmD [Lachnospiraceae bacterium]|nr:23S rRNA (uracil(1939)-C(5))-methyltransferase RlmD [Lachnospiraceae bacterium]